MSIKYKKLELIIKNENYMYNIYILYNMSPKRKFNNAIKLESNNKIIKTELDNFVIFNDLYLDNIEEPIPSDIDENFNIFNWYDPFGDDSIFYIFIDPYNDDIDFLFDLIF